jgi:hypothetical protein
MFFLQWFEDYASASPDALAITCEGRQLTYRELNFIADQIADGLSEAGVGDGCLVGILLDRSPEMLLALLDCDPNTGKHVHQPFRDWHSFKASFRRAWTEVMVSEFGMKERLEHMMVYRKIKIRTWLASRSRRLGRFRGLLLGAEGYLAPAIRNYELRSYPGKATLFVAMNEPGCNPEPANAWAGKILGGCDTRLLPGTHRSILTRPQVTTLAQEIRQRLLRNVPAPATSVVA